MIFGDPSIDNPFKSWHLRQEKGRTLWKDLSALNRPNQQAKCPNEIRTLVDGCSATVCAMIGLVSALPAVQAWCRLWFQAKLDVVSSATSVAYL